MASVYRVQSTISTSNANIKIRRKGQEIAINMSVSLTASVVKTKMQYFCLGRMFSRDVTTGATGSGQLSVYEMYAVFGEDLKDLLRTGKDSQISIECTAKSDNNEYNLRRVVLKGVVFDQMDLFNIDDQNIADVKNIPFTFSDLDFIEDFNGGAYVRRKR